MDNVVYDAEYIPRTTTPFTKQHLVRELTSLLAAFLAFAVVSIGMVVAMAWSTWKTPTTETLTDVGFMLVPYLKGYYAPDVPVQVSFVIFAIWLLYSRPTHFFYAIRKMIIFSIPMFLYRGLCLGLTVMPDPDGLCIANSPVLAVYRAQAANVGIPNIIKAYFSFKIHLCGDLIFSGHTLFSLYWSVLMLHLMSVPAKSPKWVDTVVAWGMISCYVITIFLILACRFHYSVDIVVASFSCVFSVISLQALTKWLVTTNRLSFLKFVIYGAFEPRIDEQRLFLPAPIEFSRRHRKYLEL